MPGNNQITFGVGFNVNESGLNKLKQSLQEIQKMTGKDAFATGNFSSLRAANTELAKIKESAKQVENALIKAFNPQLGTTNLSRFSAELSKINIGQFAAQMNSLGAIGQSAFLNLTKHAMSLQAPLKQNYTWLTKIGETLTNTIKWNIASSAINSFTGSISNAFNYVKALDSSLTDIRIVTGQSREEMAAFADQANIAAQALGRQTKEYTNAALAYYQQGLSAQEVQERTVATLKAQNITGAGTEMTDYLTAVWNGYKATNDEIELYVDKLALVADSSASNLAELATGMSKVAATANNMGVTIDQLTAQLSTIIATTRQAPETVGNALKTIYARINDIKAGTDEADISLGNYTKKMASLGINVLDSNNELRATGEVMEEIGARWSNMTREQQVYLAQTMAGQRQMNNLLALFDNWTQYSEMLNVSLNAQGTLNEKNSRYMESLSAHINQFKAAVEGMQDALIDEDSLSSLYDAGSKIVNVITMVIDSMGGMKGVLAGLGVLGSRVFSEQIASSVVVALNNLRAYREQARAAAAETEILQKFNTSSMDYKQLGDTSPLKQAIDAIRTLKTEVQDYANVMGQSQRDTQNNLIAQKVAIEQELLAYDELIKKATDLGNAGLALMNATGNDSFKEENFDPNKILNIDFTSGSLDFAEDSTKELEQLKDTLTYVREEYKMFLQDLGKVKDSANSQQQLTRAIEEQKQKINDLTKAKAEARANGDITGAKKLEKEIKAANKELETLNNKLSEDKEALRTFAENIKATIEGQKIFGEETAKVNEILARLGKDGNTDARDLAILERIFNDCGVSAERAQEELKKLQQRLPELRQEADETNNAFKRFKQELSDLKVGAAISGLLQGVSSIAMGITTLKSAMDTYNQIQDGTVDATEGWLRIITSVSMGLPMMVQGITNTLSSIGTLVTGLYGAVNSVNSALIGLGGIPKLLGTISTGFAGAAGGASTFLGALAGLSPYITIIAGLTAVIVGLYRASTDETRKLKDLERESEAAQKKAEELHTKYNDLKSTITSYQDAYNAIGTLTAGTEEWYEAIEKTNEEAAKLLELWPELAFTINENGLIGINADDLEKARAAALSQSAVADVEAAQIERRRAEQNVRSVAQKTSGLGNKWDNDYQENLINATRIVDQIPALRTTVKLYGDLDNILNEIYDKQTAENGAFAPIDEEQFIEDLKARFELSQEDLNALLEQYNLTEEQFIDFLRNANISKDLLEAIESEQQAVTTEQGKLKVAALRVINDLRANQSGLAAQLMSVVLAQNEDNEEALNKIINNPKPYIQMANEIAKRLENDQEIINILGNFIGDFEEGVGDLLGSDLNRTQAGQLKEVLLANFENFGFDSREAAEEVYQKAFDIFNARFQTIFENASEAVKDALTSLDVVNSTELSPAQVEQISKQFQQAYIYSNGKEGLTLLSNFYQSLAEKDRAAAAEVLDKIKPGITTEVLSKLFKDANINIEDFAGSLEDLIKVFLKMPKDIQDPFAEAAENQSSSSKKQQTASGIVDDLHYGDEISTENYQTLSNYLGDALGEFFTITTDGTYKLTGSAKFLQEAIDQIETQQLQEGLGEVNRKIAELMQLGQELEDWTFDASQFQIGDDGINYHFTSQDYTNAADMVGAFLSQGGNDSIMLAEEAKKLQEELKNGTAEISTQVLEKLQQMREHLVGLTDYTEYLLELQKKYEESLASAEHEFDTDAGSIEDIEKYAEVLKEYGEEVYGISKDLMKNHQAAMLIAEDFLRAQAAAKQVASNIDDWRDVLKDPQKDLGKYIDTLQDVDNAYKDLLNLNNNAHLSEEFLSSAENLELMNQAIQGGTEGLAAYDQLVQNVQKDIIEQGLFDNEDGGFVIPASVDTAKLEESLLSHIDALQAELDGMNLEVGADIDDANFIAALNEMINMAGLTADQATALLASMGIDADVVEGPPLDTTNPSNYSYVSPAEYAIEPVGNVGDAVGGTFPYYATRLVKRAEVITETGSQTDTSPASFAIHVENAKRGVGSGGSINHKKAGGLGGGGGTPRKSGGGGGGGSSKKPTKKTLEKFKANTDPYHDINIKIGDVQEGLDKLQKQRNKLIGKEAVDNLRKQIELLEKEKELLKEKAAIAQRELQAAADELAKKGALIDKEGNLLNYQELLEAKQKQINEAIDIANSLEGEEQEAYIKYVEQLKKEYADLEEQIKRLDDSKQLLDDLKADFQDLTNQQIQLAIEAFDLEINVKLDLKDAQREFNEFRKKVIDQVKDDQHGALAAASARNYSQYYNIDENGNTGGIIPDLQKHAEAIQQEIIKMQNGEWSSIYGNDLAAAAADLKKYNDELMKALEEAQDVIDETHQHFLDAIDAMNDAFDTQQENLDKLDDLLEHDMEILQLVHGEENFEEMNNLLEQQSQQDIKRLNALQQEQDYWKEKLDQYEEGTEEWKKAMANWQDAFEKTQDAMLKAVENVQRKWENSVNSIMSKLRNQVFGGDMRSTLEEWDKTTWHTDRYLDSLERANGLLNLQNKYINAINNTNDPKIQERLAQLEEHQLNSLSQKTHLREIDLKIAEQQLTVLQAQIALEEAQQSKTKLRLRRDSQGNYNYQYVADEENLQDKIITYANELEEYRQMVKQNLQEDMDAFKEYAQEYLDKMLEATLEFGDDVEAAAERRRELAELYYGEDGYITLLHRDSEEDQQELQKATITEAIGLYDMLQNKGAGMYGILTTGAQGLLKGLGEGSQALANSINEGSISLIDALKSNYNDMDNLTSNFYDTIGAKSLAFLTGGDGSILELVDSLLNSNGGKIPNLLDLFKTKSFDPLLEGLSQTSQDMLFGPEGIFPEWGTKLGEVIDKYEEEFIPSVTTAMEELTEVHKDYRTELGEIQQAAGRTFEEIALGLYYDAAYTNALNSATEALIQTQAAEVDAAEKVYDALKKNVEVFKESSAAAVQAANALFLFWLALNGQTASGVPYDIEGMDTGVDVSQPSVTSPSPPSTGGSGGGGDTGGGGGGSDDYTGAPQDGGGGREATDIRYRQDGGTGYQVDYSDGSKEYYDTYEEAKNAAGFSTGGYTGDWNSSNGKLAVLHEKELVLNEEDTKNMLDTVKIVRGITDQVGAMTNAAATNFGGNSVMNALSSAGEQILQNVVINADFPAVQDAEQIKQAFNELVNLASQRASANRRVQ